MLTNKNYLNNKPRLCSCDYYLKKELLEKVNILDLINADGEELFYVGGGNYMGCCPFHSESRASFGVNPDKGVYNCFACGVSGNAIGYIMERDNIDFHEALIVLQDFVNGNYVPTPRNKIPKQSKIPTIRESPDDCVCFWINKIFPTAETYVQCPIDGFGKLLRKVVSLNNPNAKDKNEDFGIQSCLRNQFAGKKIIVCPDTDFHKDLVNGKWRLKESWGETDRKYWTEELKEIPGCVAVIETFNGGVAPLILVDAHDYQGQDIVKWLHLEWIEAMGKLDVANLTQRRFLHKIRWAIN
jgi:hypothetical protein